MLMRPGLLLGQSAFAAGGVAPVLDLVSGAAAAYSYRKLRTAYAGSALTVRRSSDSTSQNVGFVGGNFDAASYNTFIGAGTGFNAGWFDQTANANNAVQATAANQPAIRQNGAGFWGNTALGQTLNTIHLDAPDALSIQNIWQGTNGGFGLFVVALNANPGGQAAICGKSASAWSLYSYPGAGATRLWLDQQGSGGGVDWGSDVPTYGPPSLHVLGVLFNAIPANPPPTFTVDGTVMSFSQNGGFFGTVISDVGSPLVLHNGTHTGGLANAFPDFIFEMLFFKNAPTASDQTTLINNAKAYYGIP